MLIGDSDESSSRIAYRMQQSRDDEPDKQEQFISPQAIVEDSSQFLISNESSSRIDSQMQQSRDDEPDKQKQLISIVDEPHLVGAGLENLSNNCYINAALQCLTHTVVLTASLFSPKPHNCGDDKLCVFNALKEHTITALTSEKSFSPSIFVENIKYFSESFLPKGQEDCQEFLQALLQKLETCCSKDSNLVQSIFGGLLVNGIKCCNCDSFSGKDEEFIGLALKVEGVDDLHSALDLHFSFESVESYCDECNENAPKKKKIFLYELPEVITFSLKKFKSKGSSTVKISDHVAFPLEIDFQPYMTPPDPKKKVISTYYLYAFVEHIGSSPFSGHYRSFVRSHSEVWHEFNDAEVNRISEDVVLSKDAYILFYARDGIPWFASVPTASPNCVLDRTGEKSPSESSFENCDDPPSGGREKKLEKLGTPKDIALNQAKSASANGKNSSQNQQEGFFEKLGQHLLHKVFRKKKHSTRERGVNQN